MGKLDTVTVNGPEAEVLDWGRRGLAPRRGRCTAAAAANLHGDTGGDLAAPTDAFGACLSRLPGKRARPVLRGPRRGDASGLPDYWVVDVLQACGARVHLAHPLGSKGSGTGE